MNKFKSLVLAAIGLLCSISVSAEEFEVDGIYYNITSESDKTVEVTYRGNHRYSYSNEYSGAVTIPESVTYSGSTYSVTSIGEEAFYECGLTSVEIPNSVTSIGNSAFYECWNLTSVEIPNSVTSIRGNVFSSCSSLTSLVVAPDNPIYDSREGCNAIVKTSSNELLSGCQFTIIPNSVTSIGAGAFSGCSGLTSVEIPNSVTSIGESAFSSCSGLTSIEIPNSVTSIRKGTFYHCTSLTSIEIPNSVTSLGDRAFSGCSNLTSVEIGNNVTSIGISAFSSCSNLTSVELPNIYCIGSWAFYDCTSLTSVKIPNSVTTIEENTFDGCSSLTSIEIPNSVTSIEKNAFRLCTSLTSIEIPNSVTSIGYEAFYQCSGLTSVNIEDLVAWCNIKFGDESANPLCYAEKLYLNGEEVTDIVIPDGVTSIGDYVFYGCSDLTSVDIPNNVTSIGDGAFYWCSGLTSVDIPNSVTSIGDYAFAYCYGLTTEIPNSVTSIGDGAFIYCFGLTALEIPNSVTSIGDGAFRDCSNLTSVEIGNNVTSIGNSAFSGCSNLTSVVIPNSVTSIGDYVFSSCRRLTSVVIPNSVTGIGDYAFQSCSSLTSVTSYIPANKLFPIDSDTFYSVDKAGCILYVPRGAKETYATMEGWNVFENIVEIHPGYELTVTDAGYSTLYLDFTAEIPEGVEVYTAKEVDDVWLQMEQVEEVLPANTGVLVKAPAGTYKFAYSNTTAPSIENNLFKGSETDKYINVPSNSSAFVLSMVDGEVGMYLAKLTDGSFLNNANKAYLLIDNNKLGLSDDELDTSVDGAQLSLRFNFGGATDIDKVNTESYSAPVIYDMYGRKVQQIMRPGLYIINGKKVMMK